MNSIVFQRNGSRNELSFHNFSPSRITHFFISLTLKKLYKMVEFVEQSWKGKYDTYNTLSTHKIMKYLCTPQNGSLCRCAIVNFIEGAFICNFSFRQFWSFKKPIARMQVASTLRNNDGEQESISLLQLLRKMVRINYCNNFTFSITLVSPIEISVSK